MCLCMPLLTVMHIYADMSAVYNNRLLLISPATVLRLTRVILLIYMYQ